MKPPEISILIANFNKSEFLESTLLSIQNQLFTDWECIVIDDQSEDDSFEILSKFQSEDPRFKIFERPSHLPKGANTCRNIAFAMSTGRFVQWFDSDDIMLPNFLISKYEFLLADPSCQFVVSRGKISFEKGYLGSRKLSQSLYSDNIIEDYLKFRLIFFTPGPMFRREIFDQVGLFNPTLSRHQEWELFLRVVLNHPNWGVIDSKTFVYNVNGNSITYRNNEKKKIARTELEVFKSVFSIKTNPFKNKIPYHLRKSLIIKYLMVSFYYLEFRLFFWFCIAFLRESIQKN